MGSAQSQEQPDVVRIDRSDIPEEYKTVGVSSDVVRRVNAHASENVRTNYAEAEILRSELDRERKEKAHLREEMARLSDLQQRKLHDTSSSIPAASDIEERKKIFEETIMACLTENSDRVLKCATLAELYEKCVADFRQQRQNDGGAKTEVITWKLENIVNNHRYNNCTLPSCWNLRSCIINYERVTIYIQPLVQIVNESGYVVTPRPSSEFLSLRSALQPHSVSDPQIACIVLPGIDFLNLYRFPSESVIESITKLLENRFQNIIIFTFLGQQRHLSRHVIASSFGHRLLYRPYFDISIPLYNSPIPSISYSTSKKRFTLFVPLINITSTLQRKVESAIKTIKGSLVLRECPSNVSLTCDEDGQQITVSSALKVSTFVLILDRFPYFQSLVFQAVEAAVIPILVTPDYIPPWSDVIDWSRLQSNIIVYVPSDSCAMRGDDVKKAINIWRSNSNKIVFLPLDSSDFCQPLRIIHKVCFRPMAYLFSIQEHQHVIRLDYCDLYTCL
uniref:Exostosin domain-containing protein n=1 Tax=Heterorhabditis bacteriophora TaxID=37862 RepID=A0A1I7XUK5_HETBA